MRDAQRLAGRRKRLKLWKRFPIRHARKTDRFGFRILSRVSLALDGCPDHATEVQDTINKPIFVVGSPRSGTSILTWCLGQHPNILVQPESNWIGPFAVDVAIRHEIGSAHGEHSQLSALDVRREEFMAHFGNSINDLVLSHRRQFEMNLRSSALRDSSKVHEGFQIVRSLSGYGQEDSPPPQSSQSSSSYAFGDVIKFGVGDGSERFRREGWSYAEQQFTWTIGQSAKLVFSIPGSDQSPTLHVRLAAFTKAPEVPWQPVEFYVNGQKLADWTVSADAEEFTAVIPVELVKSPGELEIELKTPKAISPKSMGVGADPRLLGVCCYELSITKQSDSKSRWVDGTPEYSFYICGLRKLFPGALFIHIVRDVDAVVRSLLNFDHLAGNNLIANEQQAYEKWLRTVECCTQAERAYGSQVVYRLQYSDLINNPESALRSVLTFLGERYAPVCLEPLRLRINSSNVPASFDASDPKTDPAVVEKARRLSAELEKDSKHVEPSAIATTEMETAFDQRVCEVSQLAKKVIAKDLVISGLQKEFDERTAWALRLKEEVEAKDLAIRRWKEKVKAKDLVIVGLHKRLSRRPVEILKRVLGGNR